jgi:DNA-binding MarR family transcriptional regulator
MAQQNPRSQLSSADLPIDSPERKRLPVLLRRAWYGLNQAFRRRIAHLGITPDQFTVLRTLLENEDISQSQLTCLMASDPNTVASLLNRMEANGLVKRKPSKSDRRARCLSVLAGGRRRYEKARAIAVDLQSQVVSVLPRKQQETFLNQLAAIGDACREAAAAPVRKP